MRKMLLSFTSGLALTLVLAPLSLVHAQTVDYGSLEALFGEPVTTSAAGVPQRASEVAANMTIITADEIRQSGSRSIPTILSRVPGLDVLQAGINAYDVGVRGYQQPDQPRLLVLLDGRQVFSDDYSRMEWDNLAVNIDDIRQIEVVKGASSALFGSNATGGVINIITFNPLYDKNNVASISFGTQHAFIGDATVSSALGEKGGVKVSAGGLNTDEFNVSRPASETIYASHPYHRYVTGSSVFRTNENLVLNAGASYSEKNGDEATYFYSVFPIKTTSYSAGGGAEWQGAYGLIRNTNYVNHNSLSANTGSMGVIDIVNSLVVSQLEDQFKIGADHAFRAMLEYRHKELRSSVEPTISPQNAELSENAYAVGGTWLWQINEALSLTNALRYDYNNMAMGGTLENDGFLNKNDYTQSFGTLAANSGLVYKWTDKDTLRATFGRGVQNPSLIESGFNNNLILEPGVSFDAEGNPNLKPTIVENFEIGYDRLVPEILSTVKASVYYEINRDLKAPIPSAFAASKTVGSATYLLSQSVNVGDSEGFGGEIEVKGNHSSGFRWDASYSFQTIRDAALVAQTLGYEKSAPQHHFRLLLGYSTGPWELDTSSHYVTSTNMLRSASSSNGDPATFSATAGYLSVSGRVGYHVSDATTIAASVFNLTRDHLRTSAYPSIERQGFVTLTTRF